MKNNCSVVELLFDGPLALVGRLENIFKFFEITRGGEVFASIVGRQATREEDVFWHRSLLDLCCCEYLERRLG